MQRQIELSFSDRFIIESSIRSIPTKEGSRVDAIMRRDTLNKVKITSDEVSLYEFKETKIDDEKQGFTWNTEGANAKFTIDFIESEIKYILGVFDAISENGNYTDYHLEVEEKLK